MNYLDALHLEKEPFSTSPDPEFFYLSQGHRTALERLEIAIRLKKGLSVILGDIGVGKTTLGRALVQNFNRDANYVFHLILNPRFESEFQFLKKICQLFGCDDSARSIMDCMDIIQDHLLREGVDRNRTIVLLIDEGQNLTPSLIESLRTLLNFETNDYKLFQIVIMAQMEFLGRIKRIRNFYDRINLKYVINPFDKEETSHMIQFRLKKAGHRTGFDIFTPEAIKTVYLTSQGYPRQINQICRDAMERLIANDLKIVNSAIVQQVREEQGII